MPKVPGMITEQIEALMKAEATGHVVLHLKDGRIMEVETLVKKKV